MVQRVLGDEAMSTGLNMVMLVGNLGADPELTQTGKGAVLRMRLATTEVYFDKENQKQERTEWHTIKTWGSRAEGLAKILGKGERLAVVGRLESSSWEKDGQKHYKTEIVSRDVVLMGGGAARHAAVPPPSRPRPLPNTAAALASADLPF
jgi:single-strand DNA-binding protein